MIGLIWAITAAWGTFLLYTAIAMRWRGLGISPRSAEERTTARKSLGDWLVQAGVGDVRLAEFVAVEAAFMIGAAALTLLLFSAPIPALFAGLLVGVAPIAMYRGRRRKLQEDAREAWPHLIEEIRLLTGSMGRSIPLALLEAGRDSPVLPMRVAFKEASGSGSSRPTSREPPTC